MELRGKNIGFAMTGSFCVFQKAIAQLGTLAKIGANIIPIMSHNAATTDTRFGNAADFINLMEMYTGNRVITTIKDAEPIGPEGLLDLLIIAPATGNTIGKLACGITDTPVTMAAKAHLRNSKPVVIAISTNDGLGSSAKNIGILANTQHIYLVPFGQDDPYKKAKSLVAHMDLIIPTAKLALEGIQIQPVIREYKTQGHFNAT